MKALLTAILLIMPLSISAQTIQPNAFTVEFHSSPEGAANANGGFLSPEQTLHSAFLPIRVWSGSGEDVTYVAIYQTSNFDSPTLSGFPSVPLPPTRIVTSGNCDVPPQACAGFAWGPYATTEFGTYASARAHFNSRGSFLRPSCFGPFSTARNTWIVTCATLLGFIQGP